MKTLLLILALAAAQAHAQYTIHWHTMDAGGGSGAAGTFAMSGTLGQPDTATGAAGTFTFAGGYWSLIAEPLPLLRIFRLGGNIILAWPDPSPGFVLQATPDLVVPDWNEVAAAPSIIGDEKQVRWGPPVGRYFFRLSRP